MQILKRLLSGIFITIFVLGSCSGVWGSSGGLTSYRNNIRAYREARATYELARERYQKLGTLSSRDALTEASHQLLLQGNATLRSYFSYLLREVEEQEGVPGSFQEDSEKLVEQRLKVLSELEQEIDTTESLIELDKLANELNAVYTESEIHASYLQIVIILGRLGKLRKDVSEVATKVRTTVEENSTYPGRDTILGEWYQKITAKLEDAEESQVSLWESVATFSTIEEQNDRARLLEDVGEKAAQPRQLVLEVIHHLLEIVRAQKY
ncbi:MAG: hypothetical protein U9M98_00510 [Patescibacteria group bacterium]|nr:hypothetical protein [Patescibacteria group bacterium]